MKIGVLLSADNSENYIDRCLEPWFNLKKELDIMNIEINNIKNRKEHFTEYGMIPIKVNPIETIIEDKKPIVIKKLTLGKKL